MLANLKGFCSNCYFEPIYCRFIWLFKFNLIFRNILQYPRQTSYRYARVVRSMGFNICSSSIVTVTASTDTTFIRFQPFLLLHLTGKVVPTIMINDDFELNLLNLNHSMPWAVFESPSTRKSFDSCLTIIFLIERDAISKLSDLKSFQIMY